jgi:hypothetical protein
MIVEGTALRIIEVVGESQAFCSMPHLIIGIPEVPKKLPVVLGWADQLAVKGQQTRIEVDSGEQDIAEARKPDIMLNDPHRIQMLLGPIVLDQIKKFADKPEQ